MNWLRLVAALLVTTGCATGATTPVRVPDSNITLIAPRGERYDVSHELETSRFTVFVFYSESCPCLEAHEPRLAAIHREYSSRGVQMALVDSEVGANAQRAELSAKKRGYPFPLLIDREARLARALQVRFATQAVIVDSSGNVRYSGGIDSDRIHLHDSATPYLRLALDDLLAGREAREFRREALGCALQLR